MKIDNKTNEELMVLRQAIEDDPRNQLYASIHKYTPAARKKLDAIARQITHNMAVKRAAAGRPVVSDGYSGRQSRRR